MKRWNALTPDEQQTTKDEFKQNRLAAVEEIKEQIGDQAFFARFELYDLLWFGLAVVTAFKVGASGAEEETPGDAQAERPPAINDPEGPNQVS